MLKFAFLGVYGYTPYQCMTSGSSMNAQPDTSDHELRWDSSPPPLFNPLRWNPGATSLSAMWQPNNEWWPRLIVHHHCVVRAPPWVPLSIHPNPPCSHSMTTDWWCGSMMMWLGQQQRWLRWERHKTRRPRHKDNMTRTCENNMQGWQQQGDNNKVTMTWPGYDTQWQWRGDDDTHKDGDHPPGL